MNENKLVSIIVPVYNVEQYIHECIESLINQTYENIEIILIDDESEDKSSDICDYYAKKDMRVKVFHKKNGGVSSARNIGLDNYKGKWILFLDADDYLDINTVLDLMMYIEKYNTKIVEFLPRIIHSNGEVECGISRVQKNIAIDTTDVIKRILSGVTVAIWGILFHRDTIQGVRFNEKLQNKEDMLFLIQVLIKNNTMYRCEEYYYNYRQGEDKNKYMNYKKTLDYRIVMEELDTLLSQMPQYKRELLACNIIMNYVIAIRLLRLNIKDENYKRAISFLNNNIIYILNPFFKMRKIRIKIIFLCYFRWIYIVYKNIKKINTLWF